MGTQVAYHLEKQARESERTFMFESADAEMRGKWRRPAPIPPIGDSYLRYRGSIWDLFGDSFLIGVLNGEAIFEAPI